MRLSKLAIAAGLLALPLAATATAAIYIKMPDVEGDAAAKGGLLTIDGFRWDAAGETRAVRPPGKTRYKAEGTQLVRIDDEGPATESVQKLANPPRKPERDEDAVLTRPLSAGPGMLVVRGVWKDCREGAAFPEVELRAVSGGGQVLLQEAAVVFCAGDSFALNYERIKA